MDEIITLVADKAGIPADKSKLAVTTVLGFLKTKLPAPMASQIDSLVAGGASGSTQTSGLADAAKSASGMFGSKEGRPQP